jgi:hypothetical protein
MFFPTSASHRATIITPPHLPMSLCIFYRRIICMSFVWLFIHWIESLYTLPLN